MGPLVAIIAIVMVFGIPLSAIIGSFMLKYKRMELERGGGAGADASRRIAQLEADNAELRKRVEVLETIVTSDVSPREARVRVDAASSGAEPGFATAQTASAAHERRGSAR